MCKRLSLQRIFETGFRLIDAQMTSTMLWLKFYAMMSVAMFANLSKFWWTNCFFDDELSTSFILVENKCCVLQQCLGRFLYYSGKDSPYERTAIARQREILKTYFILFNLLLVEFEKNNNFCTNLVRFPSNIENSDYIHLVWAEFESH